MRFIIISTILGFVFLSMNLQAQIQFGINGGAGFSYVEGTSPLARYNTPEPNGRNAPALFIGLTIKQELTEKLSARLASNFYRQKMKNYIFCQYINSVAGHPTSLRYDYLQATLKFDFDVLNKLMIGVGIGFNKALNNTEYNHLEQAWNINISYILTRHLLAELSYNYNQTLQDEHALLGFVPNACKEFDNHAHSINLILYYFFPIKASLK